MELLSVREVLILLNRSRSRPERPSLAFAAQRAGILDDARVRAVVERQVTEVLAELLSWKSGSFYFGEDEAADDLSNRYQGFDAMTLLMRVGEQLSRFEEDSFDSAAVYRRSGDPTKVELPPVSWEVLAAVDGRRTAAAVAAEVDSPERQVYLTLDTLEKLGVVEPTPIPVEVPEVLLLSSSNSMSRLLRLLLLRCKAQPQLEADFERAIDLVQQNHPKALVVDDRDGSGWALLREVRRLPGKAHLPAVVVTEPGNRAGVLERMRRPKAFELERPFEELEFQQLLSRMVGTPVV